MTRKRSSKTDLDKRTSRSWIEINLSNLEHNAKVLQDLMQQKCELMAVVKANAYGHGAVQVAKCMNEIGVKAFAVATLDEGIELRRNGIQGDILILGYTDIQRVREIKHYHLTQSIIDYEYAIRLNNCRQIIQVHIKIDTGMHRLGLCVEDMDKISDIFNMKSIQVNGIYTHLCVADNLEREEVTYTRKQINCFYHLLEQLEGRGYTLPRVHIQSSYGLLNYPELHCDYARIGIALYGTLSLPNPTKLHVGLRPVLAIKSRVAIIRKVAAGEAVGYGRDSMIEKDSLIAVLPIGYADGLPRNLSEGSASVLLHGYCAPIIGRICMDQLLIDVTNIPDVIPGDIATLIGVDGKKEIRALDMSQSAGIITNELLSRIGNRLERLYI